MSGWANCFSPRHSPTVPANMPQASGLSWACRWLKNTSFIRLLPSPTTTSVSDPRRLRIGRVVTLRTWASTVTRSPTWTSARSACSPRRA